MVRSRHDDEQVDRANPASAFGSVLTFCSGSLISGVRRHERAHSNSITFLAVGSHCVRILADDLHGRDAPCWPSCTSGDGAVSRDRCVGIRCLGLSVFWQSVSGFLAALACHSRLVHSGQCDIISSVMSTSPNQIAGANRRQPWASATAFCMRLTTWLAAAGVRAAVAQLRRSA